MADNETLHQEGAQAEPEIEVTKEETEMTDFEITTAKEETEMTDFEMSKTADKKDRLYFEDLKTAEDVKAYNAQKELREIKYDGEGEYLVNIVCLVDGKVNIQKGKMKFNNSLAIPKYIEWFYGGSKAEEVKVKHMIDKLKDEISEYEERFKKRKPKTVINFLDEVVKEQKAQWLKTPDMYVIGNKSNVQMALADVILDEIRRKCGGIISSRVEAAQLFNSTLEEIMQSGSVDLSDEIDLNEIRNLVIEKAKPTMFKQLQGSWNEHGENKKYIDVDFKAISESVESGAKTFGAGAKRIGTSIKQGYDSIDKEELKKNLSDTISNLEGTLKMLNESEAATKAKQAAKSGLRGLFGKLRQGE